MSDVEKLFEAIETMRVALESANEWIGDQIILHNLSPSPPIVGQIGFALGYASETVKIARASKPSRPHDARLIEALEEIARHPIRNEVLGRPRHALRGFPSCQEIAERALAQAREGGE